jgi:hypothetical protein
MSPIVRSHFISGMPFCSLRVFLRYALAGAVLQLFLAGGFGAVKKAVLAYMLMARKLERKHIPFKALPIRIIVNLWLHLKTPVRWARR